MSVSEFIERWFGYSRRERSGTYVLIIILLAVVIVRFTRSSSLNRGEYFAEISVIDSSEDSIRLKDSLYPKSDLRKFDPNTASKEELITLGLTIKQAVIVDNYRRSGGVFRTPEEFRKIYSISDEQKELLIRYIEIGEIYKVNFSSSAHKSSVIGRGDEQHINNNRERVLSVFPDPVFDLNSADSTSLIRLNGIGEVLSVRIIKYRNLLGGYIAIDQLQEVYGIDSTLVNSLRKNVIIDTSSIRRIDLNRAEYADFLRHPYIDREQTDLILRYRRVAGRFYSTGDLVVNKIFKIDDYNRLKPYIYVGDTIQPP